MLEVLGSHVRVAAEATFTQSTMGALAFIVPPMAVVLEVISSMVFSPALSASCVPTSTSVNAGFSEPFIETAFQGMGEPLSWTV